MDPNGPVQGLSQTGHVAQPLGPQGAAGEFKLEGGKAQAAAGPIFGNTISSKRTFAGSHAETISNNVKTREIAHRFFTSLG